MNWVAIKELWRNDHFYMTSYLAVTCSQGTLVRHKFERISKRGPEISLASGCHPTQIIKYAGFSVIMEGSVIGKCRLFDRRNIQTI